MTLRTDCRIFNKIIIPAVNIVATTATTHPVVVVTVVTVAIIAFAVCLPYLVSHLAAILTPLCIAFVFFPCSTCAFYDLTAAVCRLLTRAKFSSPVIGSMLRDQNIFQEDEWIDEDF